MWWHWPFGWVVEVFIIIIIIIIILGGGGVVVGLCGAVAVVVGFCVKTARHLSSSWIWIGKK